VTKEFQQTAKNGTVRDVGREIEMLERLIANKKRRHAEKVASLREAMGAMMRTVAARDGQADAAAAQLSSLSADLQNQQRLAASRVSSEEAASRRMRAMVTLRKLRDIADAQAAELGGLQAEYTRLHMKTYPTFVAKPERLPDQRE
jgi:hypothetical protein